MNGLLAMLLIVPSSLLVPLTLGLEAALVPGLGLALLVLGVIGGIRAGNRSLWWFVFSIVLSEAFVGAGGVIPGALSTAGSGGPVLIFGAAQLLLLGYSIRRGRHTLWSALAIACFCLLFAYTALIYGLMALTGTAQ
jgi:hypothetical protein